MYEYESDRITTIFRIVNLFSAKEISDLLTNLGVNERYPHHERTTARDRVVEILNGNLDNLIRNLDNIHINRILENTHLPDKGNRYINQNEIIAYFEAKSKDLLSNEKLIGNYIDHGFIESLMWEIHFLDEVLNKKELELSLDIHDVLLFLDKSNPQDFYQVDMYSYIFGEYSGYRILVNPEYFSISMIVKDNPVEAAYSGRQPQTYSTLLYYVDKNGLVKGGVFELMSQTKMEIYRTVLL